MPSITELEKKLEELPLLPAVIVRLLALNLNDESYFEKVLALSEQDPTFALRVIKLSNSPIRSPVSPITTLRDAVIRLGVTSVAGIVTSMSAIRVFIPTKQGEKNLWLHSMQVAVASRTIARMAPELKLHPDQAYLCGLMHDIGRFVLFDKASEELNLVEESNWDSPEQLVAIEQEHYGFDHSELGCRVCKKWELPQVVIDVVANHHVYNSANKPTKNPLLNNLLRVVQMADTFSVFMMLNPEAVSWNPEDLLKELDAKCVQRLGANPPITAKQLQAQTSQILDESNKMLSGLVPST